MATLKELMGDLKRGDGRRFTKSFWEDDYFEPIFLDALNQWNGLSKDGSFYAFEEASFDWKSWVLTRKMMMYRPILKYDLYYCLGNWQSMKVFIQIDKKAEVLCWQEEIMDVPFMPDLPEPDESEEML